MTTEWINTDTGEEVAVVEEIQPKKRGRPPKDARTADQVREDLGGEYVSPARTEEMYAGPNEEPPIMIDDLDLTAEAKRIFEGDEVDPEFNPGYVLNGGGVPVPRDLLEQNVQSAIEGVHRARDSRTIVDKLVAVMDAVDAVEKKGSNAAMGYSYQRAVDVFNTVRPEFIRQGLLFTTSVYKTSTTMIERQGKSPNVLVEIEATFRVTDGHETVEFAGAGAGIDASGDKSIYKAITGCMKYGIRQLLMLPDENDPEKTRPTEKEDVDGQQPVVFTSSNAAATAGVIQGGRQHQATSAQIESIRNSARNLMLAPDELAAFIHSILGVGPDLGSNPGDIIGWLSTQTFEDCAKVAQALAADAEHARDGGA